jgi:sulfite oxidase
VVSLDRGGTFVTAKLLDGGEPGSWRLWEAELEVGRGPYELVVRAWDSAASTQPEDPARVWNLKGYMNNAWHRVHFTAGGGDGTAPRQLSRTRPSAGPHRYF